MLPGTHLVELEGKVRSPEPWSSERLPVILGNVSQPFLLNLSIKVINLSKP